MKWTNKGHEFDETYQYMEQKDGFFLFGAGDYGEAIWQELGDKVNILGFVDNNSEKQGKEYCGKTVFSIEQLKERKDKYGIVITVSPNIQKQLILQMMSSGFCYNQDFFTMEIFMSVFYAYKLNKLYFPSISFLPSTQCNLNCEACLNFTPYLKKQMVRSWEEVKEDVDVFFQCVDYIMLFHISGGEPLLYPYLTQLVEYIGEHYRDKIHYLRTVTNGTVLPKPEILETLKKYRVEVTLDDYREAVPQYNQRFDEIVTLLEEHNVMYDINKVETWIDLAPLTTDHNGWNEHRLKKHFEGCHVPWRELRGGRIYSCNYASYAEVAGFLEEQNDESYNLKTYKRENLKELMEFRLGYNTKGYVEFCKQCSGYVDINPNIVKPAKQKMRL